MRIRKEEYEDAYVYWLSTQDEVDTDDKKKAFIAGAELADEVPMDRWVNVKDRLPEKDFPVLLLNENRQFAVGRYCEDGYWVCNDDLFNDDKICYWQDLPYLPEALMRKMMIYYDDEEDEEDQNETD
jgi:hypothetical protein